MLYLTGLKICLVIVIINNSPSIIAQKWKTIYQKIFQDEQYSGFKALIQNNSAIKVNLHYSDLTLFVPDNNAFDKYDGYFSADLASYHISYEVRTINLLRSSLIIESVNTEGPPLWITNVNNELYVNNAKILQDRSNYLSRSRGETGKQQVLHIIDEVLDPVVTSLRFNPSAYDFLSTTTKWKIGSNSVTSYYHKIQENKLQHIFKQEGHNTFFIPIDYGIDNHKFNKINKYIIFGHVVQNLVLFTRPTAKNFIYESMSNGDYIYSVLSFEEKHDKLYVRSDTILGDSNNRKGTYYAEVIRANIPVKNGVIHLISQPLGISERALQPFPYLPILHKLSTDPNLDVVYEMGNNSNFNKLLKNVNKTFTYFVARDTAWRTLHKESMQPIENNFDVLSRHLVVSERAYSMEKLLAMSRANNHSDFTLSTLNHPLRISVLKIDGYYYIKWYNKYIKVVRPDYECSNGIIHIINGPLAIFKKTMDTNQLNQDIVDVLKRMYSYSTL